MKIKKTIAAGLLSAAMLSAFIPYSVNAVETAPKVRVMIENNTNTSAPWSGVLADEYVELQSDSTAVSVFKELCSKKSFTQTGADSNYVSEINGLSAEGMGGWMFSVDDWFGNSGISAFKASDGTLKDGDVLCFAYSMNWGADLGADFMNTSTKLSSLKFDTEIEDFSFSPDTLSYTLTLPENTASVTVTPTAENKNYRYKIYKNDYDPEKEGYRGTDPITVNDGDKLYIGVGEPSWHSYMPEGVTKTVYTLDISIPSEEASETDVSEVSEASEEQSDSTEESSGEKADDITTDDIINSTNKKLLASDDTPVFGNEWNILTLARHSVISDGFRKKYTESVRDYLSENKLSSATEAARVVLALSSLGADASDFYGNDLTACFSDYDFVSKQGINGIVYSLIALDSCSYEIPSASGETKQTSRELLLEDILSSQLDDGGWTFYGDKYDTDMTAMVLQALAPYVSSSEKVSAAADKALSLLSSAQNKDGTYSSYGADNCESTAQVLTALTALGIDPDKDSRFIKNGNTVTDGIKSFYVVSDTGFSHIRGDAVNLYSTQQACYALCAYKRSVLGKTSLYDMSDVTLNAYTSDDPVISESAESSNSDTDEDSGVTVSEAETASEDSEESAPENDIYDTKDDNDEEAVDVYNTGENNDIMLVVVLVLISAATAALVFKHKNRSAE